MGTMTEQDRVSLYNQVVFELMVLLPQLLAYLDYRWVLLGQKIQPIQMWIELTRVYF